jgi:ribosome-associated protein
LFPKISLTHLERIILSSLDNHKAEDIVSIDLTGKSDFADRMIVASGTSARHVGALADHVVTELKKAGYESVPVEGKDSCDWVLVDAGDIVIHLFHAEARAYYNLEKMWSVSLPTLEAVH